MGRSALWAFPALLALFVFSLCLLVGLNLLAWHRVLWMVMMHKKPSSALLLALFWSALLAATLARSGWAAARGLWAERRVVLAAPRLLEGPDRPPATVVADTRPFAFTWGVFRPRIVVSQGLVDLLNREELLAVLWHEAGHARARDPGRLFLGRALAQGLFFLPMARFLLNRLGLESELQADAAVIHRGLQVELASALLKLARCAPVAGSLLPVAGAMGSVALRIDQILRPDVPPPNLRPARSTSLVSLAAFVTTLVGFWISICRF